MEEMAKVKSIKKLSRQQSVILKLMCENYSSKEIAAQLHLSKRTVDFHRKSMMDKLSAKNAATLVKRAIDNGIM